MAIDKEFPILEYLIVNLQCDNTAFLMLPETLQTPNLHHLLLRGFTCPIRSRLHPTTASLVALSFNIDHQAFYFQPDVLLQWISFMPQLEHLEIAFHVSLAQAVPDMERITTHITLPNLRLFWFRGDSAYLEAVVCRITTPRLETLEIGLSDHLRFSCPRLLQFMDTQRRNLQVRRSRESRSWTGSLILWMCFSGVRPTRVPLV